MRSLLFCCFSDRRRGGVTPLAVLSLTLLLGVIAVVVDGGMLMESRRHVQAAADASALAAATDLYANYATNNGADTGGTALSSALATAAANGFSNDGVQSVVTVNISPAKYQGGPNAGTALPPGYVEVIIQYNAGRLFSNIFGSGALPVSGRAVARGQWIPSSNNVMALNPSASGAVNINGGLNIGGGLLVNSGSSSAITAGLFSSLNAVAVSVNNLVGGLLNFLLSLLLGGATPIKHDPTIADPLRYLPAPDPVQLGLATQGTNLNITSGNVDLYPGVYNGGITISQGANVTLHPNSNGTPGIYFLQGGGLQVSGSSSLVMVAGSTAGVMIYNNWQTNTDNINLATSGSMVLTPPSSGTYQGLTIFQKRGTSTTPAPALTIVGGGNTDITGTIYVAYGKVTLTGIGSNNMGGQIIADTVNSNGSVNVNPQGKPIARERKLGLVE
jgi:Flp pilus assembly protein TadG